MWYSVCKARSATKLTRRRKPHVTRNCGGTSLWYGEFHPDTVGSAEPSWSIQTDGDSTFSDQLASYNPNNRLSSASYSEVLGVSSALSSGPSCHTSSRDTHTGLDSLLHESGLQNEMSAILKFCYKENERIRPEQRSTSNSPTFGWTMPPGWSTVGKSSLARHDDANFDHQRCDGINRTFKLSADNSEQMKNLPKLSDLEWEKLVLFAGRHWCNEDNPYDPVPLSNT